MLIDQSLIGHTSLRAAEDATWAESAGFDGVWTTESVTDAFLQSMAVSLSTDRISIGTAIAVAFARNPMSTAYSAWDLAAASDGRFSLGLGSQIEAHITRRFSMPWSPPVARMRDYIGAIRAIFDAWRNSTPLRYEGEVYRHTLMSPVFTPPHHEHKIPIGVAAVGPKMTNLAGELCDFVILHGMIHPLYFDQVTLPALEDGLEMSGRQRADVTVSCPLFMVMGDDEETITSREAQIRGQFAFYASTPAYRQVLDLVGYGDLQPELQQLSRADRWDEMSDLIDDELLGHVAFIGTPEEMPGLVRERFEGRLDRVSSYFGWPTDDPDRLTDILRGFHSDADSTAQPETTAR